VLKPQIPGIDKNMKPSQMAKVILLVKILEIHHCQHQLEAEEERRDQKVYL
jgi:hypothetical protein